jgi:hypothetical protein
VAKGLEKLTREGHQPYAAEQAHGREMRAALAKARETVADRAAAVNAAEAALLTGKRAEEAVWEAAASTAHRFASPAEAFGLVKGADRAAYAKLQTAVGKARQDLAEAERYLEWLDGQVQQSDARLAALEPAAVAHVGKVARALHEAAVSRTGAALTEMLDAFAEEQEVRATAYKAVRIPGKLYSGERIGRHIRSLGSLDAVGGLAALEHAVNCWRIDAAKGGYAVAKPDRVGSRVQRFPR